MFDVYIRVSRLGERTEDEATETYEAQCRVWAERQGLDIDEVAEDTDVSGSVAVADRKLERLIQRVEAGESEGILTPYLDRFGRDMIEGALAYRRIKLAGGRLVCVNDGTDSHRPGDDLVFNVRMAIAEDYLNRTRAVFHTGKIRAAERGVYLSGVVPFGYTRDEEGRLVINEAEAKFVRALYRRRGEGASVSELQRFLSGTRIKSRTGVRSILSNRAYVGEMTVPTERKGETRALKNVVPPILTEQEWEAGQLAPRYWPNDGSIASQVRLAGLVYCEGCGGRVRVNGYGPADGRKAMYACVNLDCSARASASARRLDPYVDFLFWQAAGEKEPHIAAVIEGDTRYGDAQAAVEDAKRELETYRAEVKISDVGADAWKRDVRVRQDALDAARRALSNLRPVRTTRPEGVSSMTFEEYLGQQEKESAAKFIDRVVLRAAPKGRGRWEPIEDRVAGIHWAGADKPWRPTYAKLSQADEAKLPK